MHAISSAAVVIFKRGWMVRRSRVLDAGLLLADVTSIPLACGGQERDKNPAPRMLRVGSKSLVRLG